MLALGLREQAAERIPLLGERVDFVGVRVGSRRESTGVETVDKAPVRGVKVNVGRTVRGPPAEGDHVRLVEAASRGLVVSDRSTVYGIEP